MRTLWRSGAFVDRDQAGDVLASTVTIHAKELVDPIVVALPRGGVQVAVPVAHALHAPLEIVVVRKVGAPQQPELAIGAVDEDGEILLDRERTDEMGLTAGQVGAQVSGAQEQLRSRVAVLRGDRAMLPFDERDVVLVDDGFATGMTARCAARYLARHGARRVILAVPVAPAELRDDPAEEFDVVLCPYFPRQLRGVSAHYLSFDEVTDAQVRDMLAAAGQ
ncbi:MAG: phosphoribosyltransferase [Thermoleophilia bacterium]|nr:phosphoribosyltransferase [Thermoleophilia bacterium]